MKSKTHRQFWKLGNRDVGTEMFDIHKDGELIIREGHYQYNVYDLARKFGTSLEIFMPFVIEERLNKLVEVFGRHMKQLGYKGKFFYHYPMKVNQNKEAVLPLVSEGAHLEVGSVNELTLVCKLWEGNSEHHKNFVLL